MTDIWSKKKRSEVMSRIRSKNTKPEIFLRKELYKQGFRYRIHKKELPGKPDIVFGKYRIAIFVHGCFWHYHKDCNEGRIPNTNSKFWKEKLTKTIERDKQHLRDLEKSGWKVLVFWECEIEKNIDSIIDTIKAEIEISNKKKSR